jgi:proteasome accessory factor A
MVRPMFGVESEYAIAGVRGVEPMRREDLVNRIMRAARRQLAHLPDTCAHSGIFLANGARFYVDCGLHPEMTTPECVTPFEVARYIKAGERILENLTREVQAETGAGAEIMCFRCNVDYSGSCSTWGSHESYRHHADPAGLPDQLIPHLVTRVVYAGAGGFNPLVSWPEFCVAPRLMHIQQTVSGDSTGNRGIFHTKNESLSGDGYHRLHIICGESLCSETAIVLKIGTTALVVAMAEEGLKPGAGLRLAAPLEALHAVASDIACKQKLRLVGGGEATAIEIQRRLLELAERNRAVLPPWAGAICALWRRTLYQLESGPDSAGLVLDWAIKRRLFHDRAARRGIPLGRFAFHNSIVQRLNAALASVGVNNREVRLSVITGPQSPIPEEAARAANLLAAEGLTWDDVERFLSLRDEFYQIDTRFGQIGPRGIFTALDRRGVLDHRVAAIDDVAAAMREPPSVGRAKLRGEAVRRLSGQSGAGCGWMGVYSPDGRTLDLSDPFAAAEAWSDPPAPADEGDATPDMPAEDLFGGDPGRLDRMLDAMGTRGRHGRTRTGAQGAPETTESPNR